MGDIGDRLFGTEPDDAVQTDGEMDEMM